MTYEPWPSPDAARGPLPRIEDLPIADAGGYDQEAVREAFDGFYRHAAQLDASLKALEAVDAFRRDAWELRNDLRALRQLGYGGGPDPDWTAQSYAPAPRTWDVPSAVPRLAVEAALIIAVAVVAGVYGFHWWITVALMAAAWAIVCTIEWLAARARFAVPVGAAPLEVTGPAVEETSIWAAPDPEVAPAVDPEPAVSPGELTVVAAAEPVAGAEPVQEPTDATEPEDTIEPEPGPEPEALQPEPLEPEPLQPEDADPWEQGLEPPAPNGDEPEPVDARAISRLRRRRR